MSLNHIYMVLVVALTPSISNGVVATGFVFNDSNGNRLRDSGEVGVANVLVSNGADVVKTDSEGRYRLSVTDDTTIFVIKPDGWDVPVNELNIPQYYYINKPAGSPELKYTGVEPTGPLPESIDFPLTASSDTHEAFTMLTFGDPQPYSLTEVDYFARDIVSELINTDKAEFGVVLGDIVGDNLDLFTPVNEAVSKVGIPFYYVYGNHDMNFDAESDDLADETFERVYGPANYAFMRGDVLFITFDDVLYPQSITKSRYTGGFTEKQLTFAKNLLEHVPTDTLIVSMMHIPLFDEWIGDTFVDAHREAYFNLFENHPRGLSLSAHTHKQQHVLFGKEEGWPHDDTEHHHYNVGTTSGSWWNGAPDTRGIPHTTMRDGTPNGYAFINFDGNKYTVDYKVAGSDESVRMNIFLPKVFEHRGGAAPFAVIIYNATEKATV